MTNERIILTQGSSVNLELLQGIPCQKKRLILEYKISSEEDDNTHLHLRFYNSQKNRAYKSMRIELLEKKGFTGCTVSEATWQSGFEYLEITSGCEVSLKAALIEHQGPDTPFML